jgi:DNA polymerase-3 subunit chi
MAAEGTPVTRVDFYILPDADEQRRQIYLCRIADKASRLGHRIWIHAPADQQAAALDERLWTFSQESFVAHDRSGGETALAAPVVIGDGEAPDSDRALLINEDEEIPAFADRFARIAEIINQDDATRRRGRAHYAYYRDRGFELHYHRIE